jgi:hypothetical protein
MRPNEVRVKLLAICLSRCTEEVKTPFWPPLFEGLVVKELIIQPSRSIFSASSIKFFSRSYSKPLLTVSLGFTQSAKKRRAGTWPKQSWRDQWIIEFIWWLLTSSGEEVNKEDTWSDCLPETLHAITFGIDGFKAEFDGQFKHIVFIMISIPN